MNKDHVQEIVNNAQWELDNNGYIEESTASDLLDIVLDVLDGKVLED